MRKYFLLFAASFIIFIIHFYYSGHGVYGDGNAYYSYSHALYFEKSLNFDTIYKHLANFEGKKYIFSRIFWDTGLGAHGIKLNPYSIGTGILWLPFLLFINLIDIFFGFGLDKFSVIYELGPGIAGICFGVFGLYFLEKYLLNFFRKKTVNLTILTIFLASNLLYYFAFEPALSHQPTFFLISFLLFFTYKIRENPWNFFLAGLLSGLVLITRFADLVLLIPAFWQITRSRPKKRLFIFLFFGFVLAITPQLIVQYLMYGNALHSSYFPYLTGEKSLLTINLGSFFESVFSVHRGLFSWSPILFVGLIGLIKSLKSKKLNDYAKKFLFSLFIIWAVVSNWPPGSQSPGFGQRMLLSTTIYLSFGLAYIFEKLSLRKKLIILTLFSLWNFLLLGQFFFDSDRLVKDEGLTLSNFLTGQVTTPVKILKSLKIKGFHKTLYENVLD